MQGSRRKGNQISIGARREIELGGDVYATPDGELVTRILCADPEVESRDAVVRAVDAEHLVKDTELEGRERRLQDDPDTLESHGTSLSRYLRTGSSSTLVKSASGLNDEDMSNNASPVNHAGSLAEAQCLPARSRRWLTAGDGIDNLRSHEVATPQAGPGQLLVRVEAVSLNYRDLLVIRGEQGWRPPQPVTPISDAAGTVAAIGPGVTRFDVGNRVSPMFLPHWRTGALSAETYRSPVGGPHAPGVLADFLVLDQDHVEAVPSTLDAAEAASLPIAALTAWHALAVRCVIRPDDRVLIHGTGGVAMFALLFATALGARTAVTTSSPVKAGRLADLGADLVIDYHHSDVVEEVLEWTGGRGVDHVVETVGGANLNHSLRAVRIGGSIAFIGLLAGLSAPINTYELVTKNVELHGIETGSAQMYRDMARFIDAHGIKPMIDSVAPVGDIQDALHRLENGDHFGKIVLAAGN